MLSVFANLGFRWKIALPILLLAFLLVLMGVLGMRGINQVTDSSSKLTGRYLPAISLLLNAQHCDKRLRHMDVDSPSRPLSASLFA